MNNFTEKTLKKYLTKVSYSKPWLDTHSIARSSVERGLSQARKQEGRYLGSFAKYCSIE